MMEYAAPTLLVVFLIESVLESRWYPPCFTRGPVIYRHRTLLFSRVDSAVSEGALQEEFRGGLGPSLLFRELAPGVFAVRHPVFEFKLFTYTPIMHGLLRVEPHVVEVEGRANWFTIAFAIWLILFVSQVPQAWSLLAFAALILAALYFFQARLYGRVAAFVSQGPEHPSAQPTSSGRVRWLVIAILILLWAGAGWYWFSH